MGSVLVALLFNMIGSGTLAPNQPMPRQNGLPIIYSCEQYKVATINPETFELTNSIGYRNCVAVREMTVQEYLDWRLGK